MGSDLESDLRLVVRRGPWSAFHDVTSLRDLPAAMSLGATDDQAKGTERLIQTLQAGLNAWRKTSPRDAEVMAALLNLQNRRGRRKLTGPDGIRARAGALLGVGADQFYRVHEEPVVRSFATFLEGWEYEVSAPQAITSLTFDDLHRCTLELHRRLAASFDPDLIVTMSGPGSFAAYYMMQFNPRDVPVVAAVTFPRRSSTSTVESEFGEAAHINEALHVYTSKWSVYIPGFVRHLPRRYRIALVDDRVITGETQAAVQSELEVLGFEVRCAALFSGPDCELSDLLVARRIPGPFQMPWGTARGRT